MSRVIEVVEFRTEEELEVLANKAMKIMELAEDQFAESYARGALAMSKTIAKVYQFCCPPRVYIGWIFEDLKTAGETAESFKILFKVRREWRRIRCRELPVVFIDFKEWITLYYTRKRQPHQLDIISLRYLENTDMEEGLKKLARELVGFFKMYDGWIGMEVIEDG